jgi:hypothetical protein
MAVSIEPLDSAVKKIAMRVVREMELAAEKAVVHDNSPTEFPLSPSMDTAERLFHGRFSVLAEQQKAVARLKVRQRMDAKAERAAALGDLAKVDLRSAATVAKQVDALPFPNALRIKLGAGAPVLAATPAAVPAATALKTLTMRLHRVKCIDETGSGIFGELGMDEIALAGTTVDETGDTGKVGQFPVKKFNDGDVKDFVPAKTFTTFSLREGSAFPKHYFVTLVLAEKDDGGLGDFVNRLLEKVKERVTAALAAAIGSAVGVSGGLVGALIGAAVGFAIGKIIDFLRGVFGDDVFPPATQHVVISSATHRFPNGRTTSGSSVVPFVGHNGKYEVTYDWMVA